MRIIYNNYVADATITALTENPNYLFDDAFKDTRLSRYGRTLSDDDQTFVFDLGSAKGVQYCIIDGHNFSSGATIHIQGNASNSWGAPSVDVTLTWASDRITYAWSSAQTYRYWRLTVDDSSNTDGYLEIAKIWLAPYVDLPGMSKSQKIPTASTSTAQESISGQSYGNKNLIYRYGNITFPHVTDAQKTTIDGVFAITDKTNPLWIIIWPDDITSYPPIYSRITADLDWNRVEGMTGRIWSLQFSFKEIF